MDRIFTRAGIVSLLLVAAMSLGCNKSSPTGPTSPATPAVPLAVTAISPARGLSGDAVSISGTGFLPGATVTLGGVQANVRALASTVVTVITPVHAAGTVDVVVTNPDGQSGTLTGGYTFEVVSITASPSLVTSGGQLTTSWVAPSGRSCIGGGDWIAIFGVGDPDITGAANSHSDLWFVHTCGATFGTETLSAPTEPGQYEFRYMVGAASVARSSPVTVIAGSD
jgi:hypothetical protein